MPTNETLIQTPENVALVLCGQTQGHHSFSDSPEGQCHHHPELQQRAVGSAPKVKVSNRAGLALGRGFGAHGLAGVHTMSVAQLTGTLSQPPVPPATPLKHLPRSRVVCPSSSLSPPRPPGQLQPRQGGRELREGPIRDGYEPSRWPGPRNPSGGQAGCSTRPTGGVGDLSSRRRGGQVGCSSLPRGQGPVPGLHVASGGPGQWGRCPQPSADAGPVCLPSSRRASEEAEHEALGMGQRRHWPWNPGPLRVSGTRQPPSRHRMLWGDGSSPGLHGAPRSGVASREPLV